ncbi:hypothetical protein G5T42_10550 [Microbacterium sp. 4R-513]|uniref:hypothetical protein n=1 Tax=Microbacterium sp. 4R-513 TaxID=2567934 RepID=UPI0013E1E466|nr:hypothetical protein [Microbacterium sp. 4R-513]QIG39870.1 hypothetical protein G5T42_10550 [Microbacterium sp. 4R-513]
MTPVTPLHAGPTRVREQPALDTEKRRQWLVPAGILAAVAILVFALTASLNPPIGLTGIILVCAFYGAMLVCAMTVDSVKTRNLAFAWLMGAMSISTTLLMLFVVMTEQLS